MNRKNYLHCLNSYHNAVIEQGVNYISVRAEQNSGVCTDSFTSNNDRLNIHISGRTKDSDSTIYFKLCLYDKDEVEKEVIATKLSKDSDNYFTLSYTFDPVSLSVYQDAASFRIFLYSETKNSSIQIDSFYTDTEEKIDDTLFYEPVNNIINFPTGSRSVAIYWLDGTKVLAPIIPKKVLFIGNSLLLGMFNKYGMCSTNPQSDYAYYVEQKILSLNPECTFKKLYSSSFEHSETDNDALNWFDSENAHTQKPARESFDSDTDLIIIQMTDNVNTDAKISVFNKNIDYFITTIKQMCHNARIVWVHGWYNKYNTYEKLIEISKKYSIELIDISSLRCAENEAYSGQLCINAEGESVTVRDAWITHPGNNGMKAIADKIIETLGI